MLKAPKVLFIKFINSKKTANKEPPFFILIAKKNWLTNTDFGFDKVLILPKYHLTISKNGSAHLIKKRTLTFASAPTPIVLRNFYKILVFKDVKVVPPYVRRTLLLLVMVDMFL